MHTWFLAGSPGGGEGWEKDSGVIRDLEHSLPTHVLFGEHPISSLGPEMDLTPCSQPGQPAVQR